MKCYHCTIGIDLGNVAGWAVVLDGTRVDSGTWKFKHRTKGVNLYRELLAEAHNSFGAAFRIPGVVIAYEKIQFVGRFGVRTAAGQGRWIGRVEALACAMGATLRPTLLSEYKGYMCPGYPNADKRRMDEAVKISCYPHKPGSEHESDAIGLALYADSERD